MKSLPQVISDLQGTASLLQELATDLVSLAEFFGGSTSVIQPPALKPKSQPASPNLVSLSPPIQEVQPYIATPEGYCRTKSGVIKRKPEKTSRKLTIEEKALIRKDWDSIPPQLRNKENRLALSRKWQCSPLQIFKITDLKVQQQLLQMRTNRLSKYLG